MKVTRSQLRRAVRTALDDDSSGDLSREALTDRVRDALRMESLDGGTTEHAWRLYTSSNFRRGWGILRAFGALREIARADPGWADPPKESWWPTDIDSPLDEFTIQREELETTALDVVYRRAGDATRFGIAHDIWLDCPVEARVPALLEIRLGPLLISETSNHAFIESIIELFKREDAGHRVALHAEFDGESVSVAKLKIFVPISS